MKTKSHEPHGPTADRNKHAAAKGQGQSAAVRKMMEKIQNSQNKKTG